MTPNNILQQVQTYNMANLAFLQNRYAFINTANTKFKNFDQPANLGDTLLFEKPPRFLAGNGLVWNVQAAAQRSQALVVDQSKSVPYEFSNQQFIFNVEDYMPRFGMAAMEEMGAVVEADVAQVAETAPYLFLGDGTTAINSYLQLADAVSMLDEFGCAGGPKEGYLANRAVPSIINSGLSQFAIDRGNKDAKSWQVADFENTMWYRSNLLTTHVAGTEGNAGAVLTVVSTTLDANGAVVSITFSGTTNASDPNSIKQYDNFVFQDGVSDIPDIRFLTFTGHKPCQLQVQFRATAAAASTGANQVTVDIYPPLQVQLTQDQNITTPIVPGMQVKVLPSHKCGLLTSGKPIFLAMPALPEQRPFDSAVHTDPKTGVSLRTTYGALLGQNSLLMGHDIIWGKTAVPEYCLKIVFPLNT